MSAMQVPDNTTEAMNTRSVHQGAGDNPGDQGTPSGLSGGGAQHSPTPTDRDALRAAFWATMERHVRSYAQTVEAVRSAGPPPKGPCCGGETPVEEMFCACRCHDGEGK